MTVWPRDLWSAVSCLRRALWLGDSPDPVERFYICRVSPRLCGTDSWYSCLRMDKPVTQRACRCCCRPHSSSSVNTISFHIFIMNFLNRILYRSTARVETPLYIREGKTPEMCLTAFCLSSVVSHHTLSIWALPALVLTWFSTTSLLFPVTPHLPKAPLSSRLCAYVLCVGCSI